MGKNKNEKKKLSGYLKNRHIYGGMTVGKCIDI